MMMTSCLFCSDITQRNFKGFKNELDFTDEMGFGMRNTDGRMKVIFGSESPEMKQLLDPLRKFFDTFYNKDDLLEYIRKGLGDLWPSQWGSVKNYLRNSYESSRQKEVLIRFRSCLGDQNLDKLISKIIQSGTHGNYRYYYGILKNLYLFKLAFSIQSGVLDKTEINRTIQKILSCDKDEKEHSDFHDKIWQEEKNKSYEKLAKKYESGEDRDRLNEIAERKRVGPYSPQ